MLAQLRPLTIFSPPPQPKESSSIAIRASVPAVGLVIVGLLGYMYGESIRFMVGQWESDDYSHGFFVPFISVFFIWQRRHRLVAVGLSPSWYGPAVVFIGLLLYVLGDYATLYLVLHLSLWIVFVGLALSFVGPMGVREIAFPLLYLLTSIPLPVFLYNALSSRLQLWSSAFGVGFLQFIEITAYREGNVIDLGPVQLQVAEACSGIRYLFPLTSLALLCAYFFRDRMWKRVLLVLSALPISVLVNGLRIGIVGVLVEYYGSQAAEGFLHLFEGWVLFLATLGLIIFEMWVLSRVQPLPGLRRLREQFKWHEPAEWSKPYRTPASPPSGTRMMMPAYVGSLVIILPFAMLSWSIGDRQETPPNRSSFIDFSMHIGEWEGRLLPVEPQYISTLRFDDYLLANYAGEGANPITLYMAYYRSQKKGQSAHSPQSCIPGGGWEIKSHQTIDLPQEGAPGHILQINRVLIQKDRQKQLVIYWFKQRQRVLSSEYLVKFYLFWDALMKGRSDGALIRLSAAVEQGETEQQVESRMISFASLIQPQLLRYVPD